MNNMKKSVLTLCVILFVGLLQSEAYSQKTKAEQVFNCEDTIARLDAVANKLKEDNKNVKKVIFIARLGKKEVDLYLSARRLFAVRKYLVSQGVKEDKIIGAFGEKTKGLGRVEIYLTGYMFETLSLGHRKDIPVGYCEHDEYDRKVYQLRKNTRGKMKKKYGRFL